MKGFRRGLSFVAVGCASLGLLGGAVTGVGASPALAGGGRLGASTATAAASLSGAWAPTFGLQGSGGAVLAVAGSGKNAYVGGSFTSVGGQPSGTYKHIAEWTGSQWVPLGAGLDGDVNAVAVMNGIVYVGGAFTHAGAIATNHLAAWDGHRWSAIGDIAVTGSEPIGAPNVTALATDGTSLYVGGSFDSAGGVGANSLAAYKPGAGFLALGSGVRTCSTCGQFARPGVVNALTWSGGRLNVGGAFDSAGSTTTNSFATWATGTWTSYGAGLTQFGSTGVVESVAADPTTGAIYAGGRFDAASGVPATGVAKLSGTTWRAVGDITSGGATVHVYGLAVAGSRLYATGAFTTAGGVPASDFAMMSGTTWSQPGGGLPQGEPGYSLAPYSTGVLVGGAFDVTGDKRLSLGNIGLWTGRWSTLGQGAQILNANPGTIDAVSSDGAGGVWVGGQFAQLGAVPASDIGQWSGNSWRPLSTGVTLGTSPGSGVVQATAVLNGQLYVAGQFDHAGPIAANNIAMWDGTQWHALGGGLTGGLGRCNSLAVVGGKLYAAGGFGHADSTTVGGVAVWDPVATTWAALPGNPVFADGDIYAAATYADRELFLGGNFADITAGGVAELAPGLVSFDTQGTGNSVGRYIVFGGTDGTVESMVTSPTGDLFVGGTFAKANFGQARTSVPAFNVAVWRGSTSGPWQPLGGGTSGPVGAVGLSGSLLYAAGSFTTAGGAPHPGVAAVDPATGSWFGLGSGGLLGPASGSSYTTPYAHAIVSDGARGVWIGGQFIQAGRTQAGSLAHWIAK